MVTANGMTGSQMVAHLSLVNRAYQLLYAMGESPVTVETLTRNEAEKLVEWAKSAYDGEPGTFQELLRAHVSESLLRYIATGRMEP